MRFGPVRLDLDLWLRGWIALQRVLLAIIVLFAHAGYRFVLRRLFAEQFQGIQKLFDIVEEVAILSLTAWLLVEAVRIFLPPPLGITLDLDEDRAAKQSNESSSNV